MNQEAKKCQNCSQNFTIESDDFLFYEKIKVPPPTFCWECRMQRRFSYRNERVLYRRKCGLTGKDVISCFAPDSGITVYDRDVWWSDQWDPLRFGIDYDFDTPFFLQFRELLERAPMPAVFNGRSVRSNYCNHIGEFKDAYLVSASWQGENIMYASRCNNSKDSADIFAASDLELCYEVVNSLKLYATTFSENSENCNNCYFLYNCKGCSDCFVSTNLRNKQYYIFNQPYTKADYLNKIQKFNLGSFKAVEEIKKRFKELKLAALRKYANISNAQKFTGDNLSNVFNCYFCFDIVHNVRDCKYVVNGVDNMNDSYDGYGIGAKSELLYEAFDSGVQASRLLFAGVVWGGHDVSYSYNCHNCENCFACIGLKKKQYCILNKQYTKEEYEKLVPKIIEHMNSMPYIDSKGRIYKYGEFFPSELSPFCYNETIAQEYFPLTKEQAIEKGYKWKDPEPRNYKIQITNDQLPDHIKDVDDSIINQIIECKHQGQCQEQCTTAFKIIEPELQFYRRMNLPLPRLCPNCRHYQRLKQRNPLKLWRRQCCCQGDYGLQTTDHSQNKYQNTISHSHGHSHCPNTFETTYALDRPEIVYCEACYNQEVV